MGSGTVRERVPFGPFTLTVPAPIVTSTPEGTGMGERPTRDISSSPHVAEDLAAHATLARLTVGHESLAGREDGDTEATEDARHLVRLAVHAKARLGDAPDAADRALALG